MTFPLVPSHHRAILLGLAVASALGMTAPGALAQSTAAPATTVPPAVSTTTPAAVPAPGPKPRRSAGAHGGGRGMNGYLAALHDELKITPAEEPLWGSFADSMRDTAQQMGQAYRQRRDQLPTMNALQDMNSFIGLEQMRLDGLKKSAAAFSALYQTMPPDQQKVADTVFLSDMPGAPRHRKPNTDKTDK